MFLDISMNLRIISKKQDIITMKTYDKQITEFGKEIADEILIKEKNPSYVPFLVKESIARSISNIYGEPLRKATEDLEDSIHRELRRRRD